MENVTFVDYALETGAHWGFFIPKSDYQNGMIKIPDKVGRILHWNPLIIFDPMIFGARM
jgi:hypothetical protein